MSVAELRKLVDEISVEDRLELEHYLAHLRRSNDPDFAADLTRRMKDMDKGKKIAWDKVKQALSS